MDFPQANESQTLINIVVFIDTKAGQDAGKKERDKMESR